MQERPAAATPLLRESLDIYLTQYAGYDGFADLIAEAQSALGACLAAQGEYAEAEVLLKESYPVLEDTHTNLFVRRDDVRARLFDLYTAWGKPEQASQYQAASTPTAPTP